MTKLLDADWLRGVQLMILPKQNGEKQNSGKLLKHKGNCPRETLSKRTNEQKQQISV